MQAFRVGDRRRQLLDATGSRLNGGRWNSPGHGIIYAAQTYAGALMEVLVHANLRVLPVNHAVIVITIPDHLAVERLSVAEATAIGAAGDYRRSGDRWLAEKRTAVLIVPSIVLEGRESNILINPEHPDFAQITVTEPEPVTWDARLFQLRVADERQR